MNCGVLPSVVSALCLLLLSNASNIAVGSGLNFMLDHGNPVASLLSSIRCPAEANPAWRWTSSFEGLIQPQAHWNRQWQSYCTTPQKRQKHKMSFNKSLARTR